MQEQQKTDEGAHISQSASHDHIADTTLPIVMPGVTESNQNHSIAYSLIPMKDFAQQEFWEALFKAKSGNTIRSAPVMSYGFRLLAEALLKSIADIRPARILEIGCADSVMLPFLANQTGAVPCGIDYSPSGCELARKRLQAEGLVGEIYCLDIFSNASSRIGQFDLVYSLGVVEHFDDLQGTISAFARFVSSNGALVTEIPNMRSLHGLLSWIYQPKVLKKHILYSRKNLTVAHRKAGLKSIKTFHWGVFTLDIVAWGVSPRWPFLGRRFLQVVRMMNQYIERMAQRMPSRFAIPFLAPFIVANARKE
jgi:2-polyprenyl-3-methyl-5-hydroxy-6-metoxy-1,4-benzoquinol methylase